LRGKNTKSVKNLKNLRSKSNDKIVINIKKEKVPKTKMKQVEEDIVKAEKLVNQYI
jgi:hypothetical protein